MEDNTASSNSGERKRIIYANACSMYFDIDEDTTQPVDEEKIDSGFAFLNPPFTGRFYMAFNGNEVFQRFQRQKNLYPLEFVRWMSDHFQTYMTEGMPLTKDKPTQETWNKQHILAYHLGDYSPHIAIYRTTEEVVELPDSKIRIDPMAFATQVLKVSEDALKMLRKNPSFEKHPRTEELESKLKENTGFLRNL